VARLVIPSYINHYTILIIVTLEKAIFLRGLMHLFTLLEFKKIVLIIIVRIFLNGSCSEHSTATQCCEIKGPYECFYLFL